MSYKGDCGLNKKWDLLAANYVCDTAQKLLADQSNKEVREYLLGKIKIYGESHKAGAKVFLMLARLYYVGGKEARARKFRSATINFIKAFELNASLFEIDDYVALINASYLSGEGYGSWLQIDSAFDATLHQKRYTEKEKKNVLLRYLLAKGSWIAAYELYQNCEGNGQLNIVDRFMANDLLHMLLMVKNFAALSQFIESHRKYFSDNMNAYYKRNNEFSYKNYLNLSNTLKNKNILFDVIVDDTASKITWFRQSESIKTVVVTFGYLGSHKNSVPFGLNMLLKSGFDVVHVEQAADTAFQCISIDYLKECLSLVFKKKEYEKIFTYGSSLGGYCAIYYAGMLNASAIAFSPRNTWHQSFLGDRFYKEQSFGDPDVIDSYHEDMSNIEQTSKPVYIIYDPLHGVDKRYFELQIKPYFDNLKIFEVPYSGHSSIDVFVDSSLVKPLILNILNDGEFGLTAESIPTENLKILGNKLNFAKLNKDNVAIAELVELMCMQDITPRQRQDLLNLLKLLGEIKLYNKLKLIE